MRVELVLAALVLAALVLAALAMLTATSATAADVCFPPAGYMRSIQGQVEIQRGLTVGWRPAVLNEPLCAGDVIRVGERSRAEASFANLTKRIDQNTTLSLTYVPEDKPVVVNLIFGAVYFFSRKPRVLEVDTPFFDAAIEGTEFLVRVEPQRALLTVFDGKITARNAQGELTVANGHSLVGEAGQAPAPYVLVRPRDAVRWALYYPIVLFALADRSGAAARAIPPPIGEAVDLAGHGEYTAAFARFEAIPDYERAPEFYLYRAGTLLSVGRVEEARTDIDQALVRDPTDGRAYALSAVIAVAQNERERALADGERGVELSPRSAAARIALSYAEQARFRIEQARATMQQAVADEPENALAWARLSELWLMQGYRGRALKAARKARKLAPELERTETVLGFAALAASDLGRAKQAFTRAIELNSADPQARFGLGLATIRGGALDEGRGDIELAVGLDPDNSLLRSYLGKAYFDSRTTNPLAYFEQLVGNFPNQENTLAAEQFAIAKRLDPNDPTPWLYDAIRKQSENRPVEALRDIEKSIELNDNRAVYRSRELLDQDRAARGTSLARIYNDLGFEQLGINEATKSLSLDPANAGAHRFLSDVYATQPRHEIAQVSELLQAQLLQDININPVQPSLSETNLNIFTGGGPARPGFNEFTPLFERNRAQLNVSGLAGNDRTRGEEAVVSGIYDNVSVSAGQFHYLTNGFRQNANLQYDITNFFTQAAITPELNVQAEFSQGWAEHGDLQLAFDPDNFSTTRQTDLDQERGRLGARFSPSANSDLLASFIYSNTHTKDDDDELDVDNRIALNSLQGEARYLFRHDLFNTTFGTGLYRIDWRQRALFGGRLHYLDRTLKQDSVYAYSNILVPDNVTWTVGFSYDDYNDNNSADVKAYSPKFGIVWNVSDFISLRAAAFRVVKPPLIANRTIQPTQIAGFSQFFDDVNGTSSWRYGVGLDIHLTAALYGGLESSWRDINEPAAPDKTIGMDETLYRAYVYWMPSSEWAVSGEISHDVFDGDLDFLNRVETTSLPLTVRYFSSLGIFGVLGATLVHQDVSRPKGEPQKNEGSENFVVIDGAIGYRLPQRRGSISLESRNLLDSKFRIQDDSFRRFTEQPFVSRFIPERGILLRVNLNF